MKDILKHEGFIGSLHFSAADDCFFGKIEGIDDLITFEGQDVDGLKNAFLEAVEDYKTSDNPWPLGQVVHMGQTLNYRDTPNIKNYVRAELKRTKGKHTYRTFTNPFGIAK